MNIGKIYALNEYAKNFIRKTSSESYRVMFYVTVPHPRPTYTDYSLDDLVIVPLEIFDTSLTGLALDNNVQRVKALFPDGRVGMIYVNQSDWEQVS